MVTQSDIDAMKQSLKSGVQVISSPGLFPTPCKLAQRMADICLEPDDYSEGLKSWNRNDCRILEPNAGTGALVGALGCSWYPDGELVAVEINHSLANNLETQFPKTRVINRDFLKVYNLDPFDRIIMNPPFINGADIKHIQHALTMLKPGGRLVALCANGPRQNKQLKSLAENSGGFWEDLPAGTFNHQGTNVNTALLVIEG